MKRIFAALLALVVIMSAGACSQEPEGPRELTSEEAERLAVIRFNNYDRHYVPFEMQLTSDGVTAFIKGRIDFQDHLAYAASVTSGEQPGYALLQWTLQELAVVETQSDQLPEPAPEGDWTVRPIDPKASGIDTALTMLPNLAGDRPENPLLLRQNGAQWIGKDTIDGVEVDKMTGPGADNKPSDQITYFVDAKGRLLRVLVKMASSPDPLLINLSPDEAEPVKPIKQLQP